MLDKLAGIENRYEDINRLLLEVGNDYQRAAELNKERIDLENIVGKSKEYRRDMARLDEAHAVIGYEQDQEMRQLIHDAGRISTFVQDPAGGGERDMRGAPTALRGANAQE